MSRTVNHAILTPLMIAAATVLLDTGPAAADVGRWRRELGRVAETYEKWGITFEANKVIPGQTGPFPSYFNAKVAFQGEDTVTFSGEVGLGERDIAAVGITGAYKMSPYGNEVTGVGALTIKGTGGTIGYRYSSKDGIQLDMGIEETFYSVGIELGRSEGSPLVLGLKGGPFKVKLDPVKWTQRLLEVGPEMAEKLFQADPEVLARAQDGGPVVDDGDADARVGGVLLTTRARFDDDLRPVGLHVREGQVVLKADGRYLIVEGLRPSVFAAVARGILLRDGPLGLSIGTQASDHPGEMKVTYLGPIRNTEVGRVLLDADRRLKGLMSGVGLGPGGRASGPSQPFLWTFPDVSFANWVRLWIVGGEVVLKRRDDRVVRETAGIRLRYEMRFRGRRVGDPDIDRFVDEFTLRWPAVAADVPELRALEEPILAAALTRWVAQDSTVELDPELLVYPSQPASTPGYVPAMAVAGRSTEVLTGGIGLDGDLPAITPGTAVALALASKAQKWMLALVAFMALAAGMLLAKPRTLTTDWLAIGRALRLWGIVVGAVVAAAVVTVEVAFPLLSDFDDEFLSLAVILVIPAALLRRLDRRPRRRGGRHSWVALSGLTLLSLLSALVVSIGMERVLLASSQRPFTPGAAAAARIMAAPLEVALRPAVSFADFVPWPQPLSLARSTLDRFEIHPIIGEPARQISVPSLGMTGPVGNAIGYHRVESPGLVTRTGSAIYTRDGRSPY